jgi:hypothetical protein
MYSARASRLAATAVGTVITGVPAVAMFGLDDECVKP